MDKKESLLWGSLPTPGTAGYLPIGVSREGSLVQHSSVLPVGSKFASLTPGHLFQEYLSTARFGKKFPGDKHLHPMCATKLKAWNDYIKIPCKAHMTSS